MQHEQVAENLSAYVEGSLSPAMAAAIDNHLRECADCFLEVTTLRRVYELLDSPAAAVEPPPSFRADTMRRIRLAQRQRPVAPSRIPFWRRPVLAGFGAVTAALLMLALFSNRPSGLEGSPAGYALPAPETVITLKAGPDEDRRVRLDASRLGDYPAGLTVVAVVNGTFQQSTGIRSGRIVVNPTTPGEVVEVTLAPVAAGAVTASQGWTVFIPASGPAAAFAPLEAQTVRQALATVSRMNGVSIVAPTSVLARSIRPSATSVPAESALADIAGQFQMRAESADGAWYILP